MWAIHRKLIEGDVREGVAQYAALETIDVDRSFDQMKRAAAPLHQLPAMVLSADRAWGPQIPSMIAAGTLPADVPPDFGYVTDAAQKEAQEKLAHLVPNAKHISARTAATRYKRSSPNSWSTQFDRLSTRCAAGATSWCAEGRALGRDIIRGIIVAQSSLAFTGRLLTGVVMLAAAAPAFADRPRRRFSRRCSRRRSRHPIPCSALIAAGIWSTRSC